MKTHRIILLALFIIVAHELSAQLTQGSIMAGGTLSSSWGSSTSNPFERGKFILGVTPNVGYFISDKFLIGVSTPIQIIRPSGLNTGIFGFSPFARIYFGDYKYVKFFFIGKAGYNDIVKLAYGDQSTNQNATGYLGSGINLFLSKELGIEGILKYEGTFSDKTAPGSAIGGEIGIQYFFSAGGAKKR